MGLETPTIPPTTTCWVLLMVNEVEQSGNSFRPKFRVRRENVVWSDRCNARRTGTSLHLQWTSTRTNLGLSVIYKKC